MESMMPLVVGGVPLAVKLYKKLAEHMDGRNGIPYVPLFI